MIPRLAFAGGMPDSERHARLGGPLPEGGRTDTFNSPAKSVIRRGQVWPPGSRTQVSEPGTSNRYSGRSIRPNKFPPALPPDHIPA